MIKISRSWSAALGMLRLTVKENQVTIYHTSCKYKNTYPFFGSYTFPNGAEFYGKRNIKCKSCGARPSKKVLTKLNFMFPGNSIND